MIEINMVAVKIQAVSGFQRSGIEAEIGSRLRHTDIQTVQKITASLIVHTVKAVTEFTGSGISLKVSGQRTVGQIFLFQNDYISTVKKGRMML